MKIVADTNTFLAVALHEPERDFLIRHTRGYDLVAPEILPFEIGKALTAMMKKRILKAEEVINSWDMVKRIPVELLHIDIRSALQIGVKFNLYAYDAYFLECANRFRCPLLTLDLGMRRIAREVGITILE